MAITAETSTLQTLGKADLEVILHLKMSVASPDFDIYKSLHGIVLEMMTRNLGFRSGKDQSETIIFRSNQFIYAVLLVSLAILLRISTSLYGLCLLMLHLNTNLY